MSARFHRPTFPFLPLALVLVLWISSLACVASGEARTYPDDARWYAIHMEGTLCGYAVVTDREAEIDGVPTRVVEQDLDVRFTALGMRADTTMHMEYHLDPGSDRYRYHSMHALQGPTDATWTVTVEGGVARVYTSLSDTTREVPLPDDVILDHPLGAAHLARDFGRGDLDEAVYAVLDVRDAAVHPMRVTRVGTETVEILGQERETVVVEQVDEVTGVRARMWLEPDTGQALVVDLPNGRRVERADATVTKRLKVGDIDPGLLVPAGVRIADVPGIESMTVRAVFEPMGLILTPEDLNVPGQTFTGTVVDNRIEGEFRIAHARYDGAGAPPFPTGLGDDPALAAYLGSTDLIQAADPVLEAHARELTAGSKDAWEAATRISRWVADNIEYAIPGGGTARRTFDLRAGECGAHSNLVAALARAVDIPTRVVWGCMYVPTGGGRFGQHGWNEFYMGEAGWVPVDATAYQVDFVDSGHIRIGEHTSLSTALNPVETEVLTYTMRSRETGGAGAPPAAERFAAYLGAYTLPQMPDDVTVDVRNGALVVDIPNKVALAMKDPDERGRWYCTMTDRLYVTFERDDADAVRSMTIHELVHMQRKAGPETVPDGVPAELHPLLGTYTFPALGADFRVVYDDDRLAVDDPLAKIVVHLGEPDADGSRLDEFGKNRVSFARDADGTVSAMILDAANRFTRK
jgi:hypothetical protein